MEKLIAPLAEDVHKLKERGNKYALDATGPTRVEKTERTHSGTIKAKSAIEAATLSNSGSRKPICWRWVMTNLVVRS